MSKSAVPWSLIASLTAALTWVPACGELGAPPSSRPNIILIIADDQEVGIDTVMQRFTNVVARQGTTFTNAFVTFPLCCPSRVSILRGQYAHNHGVLGNTWPQGGFGRFHSSGEESSTIATWLRGVGYRTALIGKYLNQYGGALFADPTYIPPGWDEWYAMQPGDIDAQSYYNYTMNQNGQLKTYGNRAEDYNTDVLSQLSLTFVRRQTSERAGEPFLLYIALEAPHEHAVPAARHRGLYFGRTAPRTPSFNEADVSDKPAPIRTLALLTASQITAIDSEYAGQLGALQSVDDMVDSLIRVLGERNVLQNTYIFYTSDNGLHMGQHRMPVGKQTPYEEDIRVPLFVRGPGVVAGRIATDLVLNIDLAPTFAEIAGANTPSFVDGRSLIPLLGGTSPPDWRKAFYAHIGAYSLGGLLDHGIRTTDRTYVERERGEFELYDLRADPFQLVNIYSATNPLTQQLKTWLTALSTCSGQTCRTRENAPPP